MKNRLYLTPLIFILLALNGCVGSGRMKCPGFTTKSLTHNAGYAATSLHRHERKSKAKIVASSTASVQAGGDGFLGVGGGRSKAVEIKLPKMLTASIKSDAIEGMNEMFKVESKSTVSLTKGSNNAIYLKAKSMKDFKHLVLAMSKRRRAADHGGGGGGSLGLAAGIIGIIAFVLAFGPYVGLLAFPLAIVAIILGILGLGSGRPGWAIAGIIFGILAIVVAILFLLLFFASLL